MIPSYELKQRALRPAGLGLAEGRGPPATRIRR